MVRVFSAACVVLLLLGLGGRALAGGKLPIAILGLEVYDNGSGIDPETTRAAKDLTAALRDRAKAGTGPYTPVQGGDKELIDEKLLNNCDSEAASCMAAIGSELGAQALMYGKIEKATRNGQAIYRVSLKLLHVGRKQLAGSTVETIPVDEAAGVRLSAYAKAWYGKLAGGVSGGTLVVKANIDRGTVLVDGAPRGSLASGTLTLTGVPAGRHTLAIEAENAWRYEAQVTVRTGETATHNAAMVAMSKKTLPGPRAGPGDRVGIEGTATPKPKRSIWKPVFYGAAVVTAGTTGFSLYELLQGKAKAGDINSRGTFVTDVGSTDSNGVTTVNSDQCGSADVDQFAQKNPNDHDLALFKSACNHLRLQKIGWIATGVVGAVAIGSFVMAYLRDDDSESETSAASRGHRKHRQLVVTPVVMPQGGGATLRFDW